MQKSLLSLGVQLIGSTTDVQAVKLLQERFSQDDPPRVKKTEPIYDRGAPTEYERSVEYTYQEQLELDAKRFLEFQPFNFLMAVPSGEGGTSNTLEL